MRLHVKLFAILRDKAGASELMLVVPDGATVGVAAAALLEQYPALRVHCRFAAYAVNQAYAQPDAVLSDGDELAVIPPVSGG